MPVNMLGPKPSTGFLPAFAGKKPVNGLGAKIFTGIEMAKMRFPGKNPRQGAGAFYRGNAFLLYEALRRINRGNPFTNTN